jgi:outer membrane usher protein FimD/PapC
VLALTAREFRAALVAAASCTCFPLPALQLKLSETLGSFPPPAAPAIPVAPAALAPRAPYPHPTQPLVVALSVNALPRGDHVVRMTGSNEFLLRREDLAEIASFVQQPAVYTIEGEEYIELRAIPRVRASFDEKTLTLAVSLPPEELPRQRFDLTSAPNATDFFAQPRSLLFNYRLGYAGADQLSTGTASLAAETAYSHGEWLFRNQSFHSRSRDATSSIRLESQAIHDDRETLRRLTIGDNVTPGLVLGASVPFAGISYAKAYQLEPYLNRHPGAGFRGLAEFPSQVDFYVGNTLVMRQQVAPGPFDIQNFSYYGGRRDVRVVIRDAFGREQTVAYPFYFANQGLAAGLHDYSYQAGWLRGQLGVESNDYGRFAYSAFHQYGFSDAWTLGLRTEGTPRMVNGGPDVFWRNEWLGLFALHAGFSRERDSGKAGHALSLSHAFMREEFSSQVVWQRFSPEYVVLSNGVAPRLPRHDFNASVGYTSPALGSLNLGFTRLQLPDEAAARSVSLSYSRTLWTRMNLVATLRRQISEPRGNEIFVGLQYVARPDQNLNLTLQRDLQGVKTASLSWANQVPRGEGIAYAFNAQRQETPDGINLILAPRLDWYTRAGTLSAEVTRLNGAATSSTGYSLALSGAVVAAGGHVIPSRPIADAFAIVELMPPLSGVRVFENSQEVGRTDAKGRILLPNIGSYSANYAAIKNEDVPIEYTIDSIGKTFSPSYRSGMVVPFRVDKLRSFVGRFVSRVTGATIPLEYHVVMLPAEGRTIEIPTARNGEFYAENLPAGRFRARVDIHGIPCNFTLEIPASDEPSVALGDVMTCDAAR